MSNVLFLGLPSHGHINPTVGLVDELVKRGEKVTYFAAPEFQRRIEAAGASCLFYADDLNIFKAPKGERSRDAVPPFVSVVQKGLEVISDILAQTEGQRFDYLIHSAAFPFTKPLSQILKVPTVSSLAVFFGLEAFFEASEAPSKNPRWDEIYKGAANEISQAFGVQMPGSVLELILNKGDLNLVYTSQLFAGEIPYFDETFKFVGPPVFDREEEIDFPFDRLTGKRVLYISLGTVFGNFSARLYDVFFEAFKNWDGVVVMAAHQVDSSSFDIPKNFIVMDYVPQNEVLKHATAAITHCGMNSMNDLLVHEVPFVSLPLGADQPLLAARAEELGATVVLDAKTVDAEQLSRAIDRVISDPTYIESAKRINESFREAGGYHKAVDEIFALKKHRGIL